MSNVRRALISVHHGTLFLCIDETGDCKKGHTTDYVSHQYIGNLGKLENGIVSVNAYGILDQITFPLLFKVFKPRTRLKPGDSYKTKPELAVEIIKELQQWGCALQRGAGRQPVRVLVVHNQLQVSKHTHSTSLGWASRNGQDGTT